MYIYIYIEREREIDMYEHWGSHVGNMTSTPPVKVANKNGLSKLLYHINYPVSYEYGVLHKF